jgi:MoaA/NifB/PqqE/SkfB family radical SAM enzyme
MTSSTPLKPTRVILNFSHRCALQCEWCYVPFEGAVVKPEIVLHVVDRVAQLGFKSLTFGGGDPFQYSFLDGLLRRAKVSGLCVQVDTHAKSLRQTSKTLTLLWETVDLLGLPLDGPTADVHDRMRSSPGHFDIVRRRLEWLRPYRDRLKINTLISAKNVETLPTLASLISFISPTRWSMYQYWPLGPGDRVNPLHHLSNSEFEEKACHAAAIVAGGNTIVEINSKESRRGTYPLVHHDGALFVHAPAPVNSFRYIGSIFEETALTRIIESCGAEREVAITRYANAQRSDC